MSTSPESHSNPEPFSPTPDQLSLAGVDEIDAFRDIQRDAESYELRAATSPADQDARIDALCKGEKAAIQDYLELKGIPDSAFRDALIQRYADNSYIATSDTDWNYGEFAEVGTDQGQPILEEVGKSGRTLAEESYDAFIAANAPDANPDDPDVDPTLHIIPPAPEAPDSTELQRLFAELEAVRDDHAIAFAERMRAPLWSRNKKKQSLQAVLEAAEKTYLDKLVAYEAARADHDRQAYQHHMYRDDDDLATRDAHDVEIQAYLMNGTPLDASGNRTNVGFYERVQQRFEEDEQKRIEAMANQGGAYGKILNWYAKQSKGKKVAITVAAAAVGVATGFGAAAAAGLVGGAIATAGSGLLTASRWGRGYAVRMSKLYEANSAAFEPVDNEVIGTAIDRARDWRETQTAEQIESGDKTKRKAIIIGMGTVVVGSLLGEALHHSDDVRNFFGGGGNAPGTGVEAAPSGTAPGIGANIGADPSISGSGPAPSFEYSQDALTITPGEGMYQTFKDMGVPKGDWHSLMENVGGKLPKDLVYRHHGEWRLRMTPDGNMPRAALDIIQQQWQDMTNH